MPAVSTQRAVCVLGCRPGSAALARRARAARDVFLKQSPAVSGHREGEGKGKGHREGERSGGLFIVVCGGAMHEGRVEADELARMLIEGGIPEDAIVRERASHTTSENAAYAARILQARGVTEVVVVTCSWHLRRATKLFDRAGLRVIEGVGVEPPDPTLASRVWWAARERVSTWKDSLL